MYELSHSDVHCTWTGMESEYDDHISLQELRDAAERGDIGDGTCVHSHMLVS